MAETTSAPQKVKLTVSQIQADLKSGLDRKQIGEKYGLNRTAVTELFQHPKLKGLKTHKSASAFDLEDDVPEATTSTTKTTAKKAAKAAPVAKVELAEGTGPGEVAPEAEAKVNEGKW